MNSNQAGRVPKPDVQPMRRNVNVAGFIIAIDIDPRQYEAARENL